MPQPTELWKLETTCTVQQESLLEEAFADSCVAFSSLVPDAQGALTIEILFQQKPSDDEVRKTLARCGVNSPFTVTSLGSLDWIREVARNLEPMQIGRWVVYGAAFRDQAPGKALGLQIDATSAFGTGEHPTTRGCLLKLDELLAREPDSRNWRMLDMGCGSGILAMAFAKATNGQALGVDMDEDSVAIAHENIQTNGVADRVHIVVGTGYAPAIVHERAPYDLIMANVFADPLCEMAADLAHHLKPGGHAILSGILNDQADRVVAAHSQQGLILRERTVDGEWSVLALWRPTEAS